MADSVFATRTGRAGAPRWRAWLERMQSCARSEVQQRVHRPAFAISLFVFLVLIPASLFYSVRRSSLVLPMFLSSVPQYASRSPTWIPDSVAYGDAKLTGTQNESRAESSLPLGAFPLVLPRYLPVVDDKDHVLFTEPKQAQERVAQVVIVGDPFCKERVDASVQLLVSQYGWIEEEILPVFIDREIDLKVESPVPITHVHPRDSRVYASDVARYEAHLRSWEHVFRNDRAGAVLVLEPGVFVTKAKADALVGSADTMETRTIVAKGETAWHAIWLRDTAAGSSGQGVGLQKIEPNPFARASAYILSRQGVNFLLSRLTAYHAPLDMTLFFMIADWYRDTFVVFEPQEEVGQILGRFTNTDSANEDGCDAFGFKIRETTSDVFLMASEFPAYFASPISQKDAEQSLKHVHHMRSQNLKRLSVLMDTAPFIDKSGKRR
ncbi:hypothetical protein FVE85_2343 [Porphyridium purpureum]|uniref:Uncharacterized protein n=1 Tax=Porphyridium purpureum TaxID=35688 RepID=A0A5J4YYI9_PORPP|nr:hypothetical protein FVE85_2343 [Porphyridium purpureum]|eukprot:POR1428..scf209_3